MAHMLSCALKSISFGIDGNAKVSQVLLSSESNMAHILSCIEVHIVWDGNAMKEGAPPFS